MDLRISKQYRLLRPVEVGWQAIALGIEEGKVIGN